ncbi:hypothetical protein, partial [Halobacillus faecis]|uniref:hypothetical protein n=1 Tax=Halobacillus faecis TaxID=360184 RepID=UPI001C3F7295
MLIIYGMLNMYLLFPTKLKAAEGEIQPLLKVPAPHHGNTFWGSGTFCWLSLYTKMSIQKNLQEMNPEGLMDNVA